MSRSFKKVPGYTEGYGGKWRKFAKCCSWGKIRHILDIPDGGHYKKIFNSWDICDYKALCFTRRDLIHCYQRILRKWPCFRDLNRIEEKRVKQWIK